METQDSKTGQKKRKLGKIIDTAKLAVPAAGAAVVGIVRIAPKIVPVVKKVIFKK